MSGQHVPGGVVAARGESRPDGEERIVPVPAYRHDPALSVLALRAGGIYTWGGEPAVCGYRKLTYFNQKLGRPIAVPISATPAVVAGVGVLVASDDGFLRLFNPSLDKEYWHRRMDSSVYASLVADVRRQHVIVAATSGQLTCVDLRGTLVWSAHAGVPVCATPTVLPRSDLLVVAGFHSRCLGLDLASGTVRFDREVPRPWSAAYGGVAAYRDPYASPAPTTEGTVVVGCAECLLCIAPDGTDLWRHDLGQSVKSSPVALHAAGAVLVCAVDGSCVLLDSRSGRVLAQVRLGSKITASGAVSGDIVAIGVQGDISYGLNARTLATVWTSSQGSPRSYTSFTVLPGGDFVATNGRGNVVCLGRDDGQLRWESSQVLGLPDHEPAMDITPVAGPDGNMYCASYAGDLYRFAFQPIQEIG